MPSIAFAGFAPDLDPATPGIITDCSMLIPTARGYKSSPALLSNSYPALPSDCRGAAYVTQLDGTGRFFAGTQTKIYEGGSTAWDDVSDGSYVGGAESRWRFAQFGDTTYATNKADVLQSSTGSGAFAADAGGIKASFVEVISGFVMLADTNEASNGDQSDRWWCSGYMSGFTGTPDVTTQETTGRLVDVPGPIRAIRRLGSNIVVYKNRGMWLGQYVGAPAVWQFTLIPGEIGCGSQEAAVDIGSEHVFLGYENFYRFDGSRPVPIGDAIKRWFFSQLNQKYRYRVIGAHDRKNSLVRFYYPSTTGGGAVDSCVVYNYQTNKWGRENRTIEAAVEFLTGQVTYTNLGTYFPTYDDIPSIAYDSPFFNESSPVPTIFDGSHTPGSLIGASEPSSLTTGDMGDNYQYSTLQRVRLRCAQSPTTASMTHFYRDVEGDALTTGETAAMSDGKFDVLHSARWHRLKFDFAGDVETLAFDPALVQDGIA